MQYFLLHCTKNVIYKILEAADLGMSALSRGSARQIEASHSKHEFKDTDHGRNHHSPQSEDEQARDGRV